MTALKDIVFGGSDLDRSAVVRTDPKALADALAKSRVVVLWRGKPMIAGDPAEGATELVHLPPDHAIFALAEEPPIFLGRIEGQPVFARDLSAWDPPEPFDEAQLMAFADPTLQRHPAAPDDTAFRELRSVMATLTARDAELAATARALLNWHRSHGHCAACGAETDATEGGWQRLCPSCGARHFPRTDPVVIMLITRGEKVLLGRSPGWPERMYSVLAGFVEPGETIEAAVRREVLEESAIYVGGVDYVAGQPWPFPNSLMIGCHGRAISDEITIDPVEIENARWVTRQELLEVFAGTHCDIRAPRHGSIASALLDHWLAGKLV